MAITYREIAIQEMLRTVEEAMGQAINWWGDLPPPMKEAIEQFRTHVPVGNLRSEILVMQSAQNWRRKCAAHSLNRTRNGRVLVQR
jgi:hypothetical protein